MPTLTPGTQEYRDYYNAITLPGDTPPAAKEEKRQDEDDDSGRIRAPMSDRDEYYATHPELPPAEDDKTPFKAEEHTPKTEKGKAADARLRADMRAASIAQQQRALDDLSSKTKAEKMAAALQPGKVVGRWAVQSENGRKFFMAVSEDQALREARRAGLTPTSAKLTSIHTYTPDELAEAYSKIGTCGTRASRRAEFEKTIKLGLVPEDAEFELIGEKEWGYKLKGDPTVYKGSEREFVYVPPEVKAAQDRLAPYRDGDGYNLVAAITAGITDGTLLRAGFDAETVKDIRAWTKKHNEVLTKLTPYWSESAPSSIHDLARTGYSPAGYNIDAALKAGVVSASDLIDVGFDRASILEATEHVSMESFPSLKRHEQFHSDVVSMWEHAYPEAAERLQKAGLGFSLDTIKKIDREMKDRDVFALGDAPTADKLLQVLAAAKADGVKTPEVDEVWRIWHEGADEYKSWLIGLPMQHPEKKAMLRRVGNVVLAASTVFLPGIQQGAVAAGRTAMSALGTALRAPGVSKVAEAAVGYVANVLLPLGILAQDAAVVNEALNADNMQRKHEAFLLLPEDEQDYWKGKAGVDPTKPCGDTDMAKVLATYSVPAGYSLSQWSAAIQGATDTMEREVAEFSTKVREKAPAAISEPVVFAANTVAGVGAGVGYMGQLPLLAGIITDRIPEGDAKEYAASVATGMAAFFTAIPGKWKADPTATSGQLVGLFVLSPKALVKYSKGIGAHLDPRFITKKALGSEFTTIRIVPPKGSVRITPKQLMNLTDKLVRQSIFTKTGIARATIKTKAGEWIAEIRNTPYQRIITGSSFHFTNDITPFLKNKVVKVSDLALFHSPQAAIRFAVANSKGKPMWKPGLVEVHMTKAESRGLTKLLGKGEAEFEGSLAPGTELHAVPGFNGKGVSFDLHTGTFPVVRYTTPGTKGWTGPSLKQLTQVRLEAAKAATADFLLGWYGRQTTLKEALFRKDPKVARINNAIAQLKAEQPELTGPNGEIIRQRRPVPHPDGKGEMKSRAKAIVHHPSQDAVLLMLDRSGDAFDFPGGSVDPMQILNRKGEWQSKPGKVTWAESVASQMKGETNVYLDNITYLDIYKGKVHPHALSGARIFEAKAESANIDPVLAWHKFQEHKFGYTEPEVASYVWLHKDGSVSGPGAALFQKRGMYPATLDILRVLQIRDGWKVNQRIAPIYRQSISVNKARDQGFSLRVKDGKRVSEADIANVNKPEIAALKAERLDHLKGQTPTLVDFLEAEPDFTTIVELLEGRRRVLSTYSAGKADAKVEGAVREAGLWAEYQEARAADKAERGERVADVYEEALRAHLSEGRLAEPYRDAMYAASRDNMPAYATRYLHYYRRASQSPRNPVREIREEHGRSAARSLQDYRQVYRATTEPYRAPYEAAVPRRVPAPQRMEPRATSYPPPAERRDVPDTTTTTPPPPTPLRIPVPLKPPEEEGGKRLVKKGGAAALDKRRMEDPGKVQWKQGRYWIMVTPPPKEGDRFTNVQYSRRPFWGVRVVTGSPERTFAWRGNPPKEFLYEMGVTKIDIFSREKPHLRYRQTAAGRANNRKGRRRGRVQR